MGVIQLPTDAGNLARAILHHLLQHGDVAGRDATGRTVIMLAVEDWLLERLLNFDAESDDLEDGGDGEPDDEGDADTPPYWHCQGYGKA